MCIKIIEHKKKANTLIATATDLHQYCYLVSSMSKPINSHSNYQLID